jgi:tRNA nucleotidyltransferase (CCA-adding enzyme)
VEIVDRAVIKVKEKGRVPPPTRPKSQRDIISMFMIWTMPLQAAPANLLLLLGDSLSSEASSLLLALKKAASQRDVSLYLVGGPVRDLLLARPLKDLDLAVEGDAAALARDVAQCLGGKVVLHQRFGTATVAVQGERLDLATTRRENYPRPGTLPQVVPGSIEEDLTRRDFTVNAMALSLSHPNQGRLLDPVGGLKDLREGTVRALHPVSFRDDPTRVLRAVRYEQRLTFIIEPKTLGWLREALDNDALSTVSRDRLRREVSLMLNEERPLASLIRAGELGVLRNLYPPLGDASHLESLSEGFGIPGPLFLLAALAFPLSPPQGEDFNARLNMPRRWATTVRDTISLREAQNALETPNLNNVDLCQLLEGHSVVDSPWGPDL